MLPFEVSAKYLFEDKPGINVNSPLSRVDSSSSTRSVPAIMIVQENKHESPLEFPSGVSGALSFETKRPYETVEVTNDAIEEAYMDEAATSQMYFSYVNSWVDRFKENGALIIARQLDIDINAANKLVEIARAITLESEGILKQTNYEMCSIYIEEMKNINSGQAISNIKNRHSNQSSEINDLYSRSGSRLREKLSGEQYKKIKNKINSIKMKKLIISGNYLSESSGVKYYDEWCSYVIEKQ